MAVDYTVEWVPGKNGERGHYERAYKPRRRLRVVELPAGPVSSRGSRDRTVYVTPGPPQRVSLQDYHQQAR